MARWLAGREPSEFQRAAEEWLHPELPGLERIPAFVPNPERPNPAAHAPRTPPERFQRARRRSRSRTPRRASSHSPTGRLAVLRNMQVTEMRIVNNHLRNLDIRQDQHKDALQDVVSRLGRLETRMNHMERLQAFRLVQ